MPQVAGSAFAAVAAAVAASQLGVYGTILGAGVMSIVATCGGSVFQHFFRRTGEQIREVTVQVKHPDREVTVHTRQTRDGGDADGTWGTPETRVAVREAEGSADAAAVPRAVDATTVLRQVDAAAAPKDATTVLRAVDDTTVLGRAPGDPGRTQLIKTLDGTRPLATGPGAGDDAFTQATTHGTRMRGWKRSALGAAVVFVVSMAGITTFELVSGNDLSGGQGTTVGSVVRGERGSAPADPAPSSSTDPGEHRPTPGQDDSTSPGTDPEDGQSRSTEQDRGDSSTAEPTPTPTPSDSAADGTAPSPTPTPSATGDGSSPAPDPAGTGSAPAQQDRSPAGTDTGE